MSRRVSKTVAVVVLALSLSLQAPSAFAAARRTDDGPGFIARIVRVIKNVVKSLAPTVLDETQIWPSPPLP